ncbi:helix-turn-helix domain-containing protein [Kribbella sp. NPDC056861]|uniref:winged helix-turn-helix transcriptional regulator n=1 Tax=Kribbella sp. NPDC056861 TaxID=3154857 RepID=UPI003427A777
MSTTTEPRPTCSIARTLEVIGDRWSVLILREAHRGRTRFADFRDVLGIAPNILTNRLAALVEAGVLEKREYRPEGERTRSSYHLTPAGVDLKLVLAALQQWGDVHEPRKEGPTVLRRNTRTGGLATVGFLDENGNAVPDRDVTFEPVPGGPADRLIWR